MGGPYLIGFSGPPRSGKDSIATALSGFLLEQGVSTQILACSTPMREAIYALIGEPYTLEHYEVYKDVPLEILNGRTIRQEMIELSERHVKPRLGQDFWARSLLGRMQPVDVLIVTDCGFDAEVSHFTAHFGVENVVYPQVRRGELTFAGDSRSYVGTFGCLMDLENNGTIDEAARELHRRLTELAGWDLS